VNVEGLAEGDDLEDLRALFANAEEKYKEVDDYRCVFRKRQRIDGKLQEWRNVRLKFRKPFEVYLKWLEGPHEGQEVLYAPARYGDKGFARPAGRLGRWSPVLKIDVDGYWVMRDNLHQLDHVGIGYFLDTFMDNVKRAEPAGQGAYIDRGEEEMNGRTLRVVECVLPPEKAEGYYCYRCILSFDEETGLPVHIRIYDWDNVLVEEYIYDDLEINTGLTDSDFERTNPGYNL
jgi:hypothetical protein